MDITRVQQWVVAMVVFVVGMGVAIPLAWVSPLMRDGQGAPGAAVGLWVMSMLWGSATIAGMLAVHRRSPLSPWLLLGLVPAAVAAPYMF